jgi:Trk K+ transport system NAD-binding subunit
MIGWVALAEALGVELILGAFLAGAIVNLTSGPSTTTMREKLDAIGYGVFIPIFFIMVGVRFDLRSVLGSTQALLMVPLLILVAYGVKLVPALLLKREFSWQETFAGGFLLSSRLSLIIAAAAIALDIGAIPESVSNAVILVAIVTCTVSPLLFNRLHQVSAEEKRDGLIIFGSDPMAELLTRRLIRYGEKITLVTSNGAISHAFPRNNVRIIRGSGADSDLLRKAGAETARSLLVLFSEKEVGLDICKLARLEFGIPVVIAGAAEGDTIQQLNQLGVRTVQPVLSAAMAFEGALHFPTAFDLLVDLDDDVEIGEALLTNRSLTGRPLRRVQMPGNALVLNIQRDNAALVPDGDTILEAGDRIALVGAPDSIAEAVQLLSMQS